MRDTGPVVLPFGMGRNIRDANHLYSEESNATTCESWFLCEIRPSDLSIGNSQMFWFLIT